jgi:hypothetical protein
MINLSDYYKSADGSNLIFNNGNSNGADIVIGTNDNYNLAFETGGVKRLILTQDSLSGNISKTSFNAGSATGSNSFAANQGRASGDRSFAEGWLTRASGRISHAENYDTTASGDHSHAEGFATKASEDSSHAQGRNTTASGFASHAEGSYTTASSYVSHAEGTDTTASGIASHAQGSNNIASGTASHAQGSNNIASGDYSHAEGAYNVTGRKNNFLTYTAATRTFTFASNVSANFSYVYPGVIIRGEETSSEEGTYFFTITVASRNNINGNIIATEDVIYGDSTTGYLIDNSGSYSHAQGVNNIASGIRSHVEGFNNTASGQDSHAAGGYVIAAHDRTWIWKGSTATNIISTTRTDQFVVSAAGGVYIPGNVGIGTDNNANALTVVGTISTNAHLTSKEWSDAYTNLTANSANYLSGYDLTAIAAASATWNSNYTTTNSNSGKWESAYTTVNASSAATIVAGGNTRGANIIIGTNDAFHLRLETNNSSKMTILSSGEVGIGTTITETQAAGNGGLRIKNNLLVDGTATIRILNTSTADDSVIVEASGLLNKRTINSRVWDTNATFLSGSSTTNTILKSTGPNTVGDSTITDNGTTVTVGANTNITGTLTATNFRTPNSTSIGAGTNALVVTTGANNTAVGSDSLAENTNGIDNTAIGSSSLQFNVGSNNTGAGSKALWRNTNGTANTAVGSNALRENLTGSNNTAVGTSALNSSTTGANNTAAGVNALPNNQTGSNNTAVGVGALEQNVTASNNTAFGSNALKSNTGGVNNVGAGISALHNNTTGYNNTATGQGSLYNCTDGHSNAGLGLNAGLTIQSGTKNTLLGTQTDVDAQARSNCVVIGANTISPAVDGSLAIGNVMGNLVTPSPTGTAANKDLIIYLNGVRYYIALKT